MAKRKKPPTYWAIQEISNGLLRLDDFGSVEMWARRKDIEKFVGKARGNRLVRVAVVDAEALERLASVIARLSPLMFVDDEVALDEALKEVIP
jgi:hypothetical protein